MRALVQRVTDASVTVANQQISSIGNGLLIFIAVAPEDGSKQIKYIVEKISNLRIFPNASGRFDKSAIDVGADLLLVSQFTLYADCRRGRRPSFTRAAAPDFAKTTFQKILDGFMETGLPVKTGIFQEHMQVNLTNDGPVTIWVDSDEL